jgi:hypothetical protein
MLSPMFGRRLEDEIPFIKERYLKSAARMCRNADLEEAPSNGVLRTAMLLVFAPMFWGRAILLFFLRFGGVVLGVPFCIKCEGVVISVVKSVCECDAVAVNILEKYI